VHLASGLAHRRKLIGFRVPSLQERAGDLACGGEPRTTLLSHSGIESVDSTTILRVVRSALLRRPEHPAPRDLTDARVSMAGSDAAIYQVRGARRGCAWW
jgi:hypothetical protein